MQWEYLVRGGLTAEDLDDLGEDEWELVSAVAKTSYGNFDGLLYVFKRPLEEDEGRDEDAEEE